LLLPGFQQSTVPGRWWPIASGRSAGQSYSWSLLLTSGSKKLEICTSAYLAFASLPFSTFRTLAFFKVFPVLLPLMISWFTTWRWRRGNLLKTAASVSVFLVR
jgi:hypothetical protein